MVGSPSQPQSQPQVASREPPPWLTPYFTGNQFTTQITQPEIDPRGYLPRMIGLSEQPWQPLPSPGERIAPFSADEQTALSMLSNRALAGAPEIDTARSYLTNMLTQAPGANPYVDQMVRTAQQDVADRFNLDVAPRIASLSASSGSFGNSGVAELDASQRFNAMRAMGDIENQIRLPAYLQERGQQLAAVPLTQMTAAAPYQDIQALLSSGQMQRGMSQSLLDVAYQNLLEERAYPYRQLELMGAGLTTAGGGYGTTTAGSPMFAPNNYNPWISGLGALGSLAGGAGLLWNAFR